MSDNIRVLHVVEPGRDGVFCHVESLALSLLRRGNQVSLGFSSVRGSERMKDLTNVIKLSGGYVMDLCVGNAPQPGDARALARLISLVRQSAPDIIHCHSSKAGIIGRVAGILMSVPTVYTPNAYYGMGGKRGVCTLLFNRLERFFASFGHTINVSEDEAAFARERLGVKWSQQTVIPNAINTESFKPASDEHKSELRCKEGLPVDSIVFGSLGRLSHQKDPLTLYRAFEIIAHKYPTVYLSHLGTGELERECMDWIRNSGLHKRIVRTDCSPETSDYYRGLDVFVMSSRYEGLSIAVLEALASDLPLVLTDVPGNRDFFSLGLSHVWTAPPESPDLLAAAMEACLLDLKHSRTRNHRAVALEKFSEEACYGKIINLYQEVAKPKSNRESGFPR